MMKPIMNVDPEKDVDGYSMIRRAGSILNVHGMKQEAKEIHQRASIEGYEEYLVFQLLKEYMTI